MLVVDGRSQVPGIERTEETVVVIDGWGQGSWDRENGRGSGEGERGFKIIKNDAYN